MPLLDGHGRGPDQNTVRAADGEVQLRGLSVQYNWRLPLPRGEQHVSSGLPGTRRLLIAEKRDHGAYNLLRVRRQSDSNCGHGTVSHERWPR